MAYLDKITVSGSTYDIQDTKAQADIEDLKSALCEIGQYKKPISFTSGGYIKTNYSAGANVPLTIKTDATWQYAVFDCAEGDVFLLNLTGAGTANAYCFVDSSGNLIEKGGDGAINITKAAPVGANKLILNDKSGSGTAYLLEGSNAFESVVGALFEDGVLNGTGEVIGSMSLVKTASVNNATSIKVSGAQMFEPLYPGVTQYGVTITRNSDGTYTIDGTATSSAWFYLNQETRTGTSNRVLLNGEYSLGYDILSGDVQKITYDGSTTCMLGLVDLDNTDNKFMLMTVGVTSETHSEVSNKAVAVALRITSGVKYNGLRLAIRLNKGNYLFPYKKYVAPVTLTSFVGLAGMVQTYAPYIWITATPSTATIGITGKILRETSGNNDNENADLNNILVKYNGRTDILAQLFTRPLFLVYTDIHGDGDNLSRIKEWYNNNKPVYVSDVYCLGDMVDDTFNDTLSFADDSFWKSTIKVVGNHDVLYNSNLPGVTESQAFSKYFSDIGNWNVTRPTGATNETYFYKDYGNAIRVIVLDTYFYTTTQHQWFVDTLADAKTNGLAVIVCQHEDICTEQEKQPLDADYPFADKQNGYSGLQYRTYGEGGDYQSKRDAVDSFIDGGGTFICWLSGHRHTDLTGYYQGTNGKQLSVVLSNASKGTTSSMRIGNYSQDCFTYVGVDTTAGYIYLLRIGEATDKWFHTNLLLCYDYVNHAVVEYK